MIALKNAKVYTPHEVIDRAAVLVDETGKITYCGPLETAQIPPDTKTIDASGKLVFPGFIDLHIHGLLGYETMGADLGKVIELLPRFGVTSFLATTLTLPEKEIYPRLEAMAAVLADPPQGANCLGIHVEGPHLSPRRPGMANPAWFHPLSLEELERMQPASGNNIRMITFAPEEGEAMELIPRLAADNIVPVIGHSDASYEEVARAVELGLNHATHTYNAMRPLHHRDPGVIGAVLAFPQITAQLIADGHHVHPGAMRVLLNAKGVEGTCLISDAAPFAYLPPGEYGWGDYQLIIDGETCQSPEGVLAGAYSLMDRGFTNLIHLVGLTPNEASHCASLTPARALGLEQRKGCLLPGWDADLVVMDADYQIKMTLVGGRIAWQPG